MGKLVQHAEERVASQTGQEREGLSPAGEEPEEGESVRLIEDQFLPSELAHEVHAPFVKVVVWHLPVRPPLGLPVAQAPVGFLERTAETTREASVVREGDDDAAIGPYHACGFGHKGVWLDEMVERALADDAIERSVSKRQRLGDTACEDDGVTGNDQTAQAKHLVGRFDAPTLSASILEACCQTSNAAGDVQRPAFRQGAFPDHRVLNLLEEIAAVRQVLDLEIVDRVVEIEGRLSRWTFL